VAAVNRSEAPSTALPPSPGLRRTSRAPSPPLGEKDRMRGCGSCRGCGESQRSAGCSAKRTTDNAFSLMNQVLNRLVQRNLLSVARVDHHGESAKDFHASPRVHGPDEDLARSRASALHLAVNLDDIATANRRFEIKLTEQSRDETGGRKGQRRRVVRHVVGPLHYVAAEQRSAVIQELEPDEQGLFVTD